MIGRLVETIVLIVMVSLSSVCYANSSNSSGWSYELDVVGWADASVEMASEQVSVRLTTRRFVRYMDHENGDRTATQAGYVVSATYQGVDAPPSILWIAKEPPMPHMRSLAGIRYDLGAMEWDPAESVVTVAAGYTSPDVVAVFVQKLRLQFDPERGQLAVSAFSPRVEHRRMSDGDLAYTAVQLHRDREDTIGLRLTNEDRTVDEVALGLPSQLSQASTIGESKFLVDAVQESLAAEIKSVASQDFSLTEGEGT